MLYLYTKRPLFDYNEQTKKYFPNPKNLLKMLSIYIGKWYILFLNKKPYIEIGKK
jgi:hypothetical protein